MELKEKIALLEETFDADEGSIIPEAVLEGQGWWDSMAKLSLIVLIEDEFGKKLSGDQIRAMQTVQDILNYME